MKLLQRILLRLFPRAGVFYIGGADTMPPPLSREEEAAALQALAAGDESARANITLDELEDYDFEALPPKAYEGNIY